MADACAVATRIDERLRRRYATDDKPGGEEPAEA
jgi:hypothetical protein